MAYLCTPPPLQPASPFSFMSSTREASRVLTDGVTFTRTGNEPEIGHFFDEAGRLQSHVLALAWIPSTKWPIKGE